MQFPRLNTPDSKNLRKTFKFSTGNMVEIFWHEPTVVWVGRALVNFPEGDQVPYQVQAVHPFRSQIFGQLRMSLAEKKNPEVKKVNERMQPRKPRAFNPTDYAPGPMRVKIGGKELVPGVDYSQIERTILLNEQI